MRLFHYSASLLALIILSAISFSAIAGCDVRTSAGTPAPQMADGISILLSNTSRCPTNVFMFRDEIKSAGLSIESTMVNNEGFHNPSNGSFSFFEIVSGKLGENTIERGDFFFGHFTTVNENNELTAAQDPEPKSLMIEAFAWDTQKELFNFYELRGTGKTGQWFYRGDSADIYADNTSLHRQEDPLHPQFGTRLRCSGCHGAGGPIMKELSEPHNDWWTGSRKLDFGGRTINTSIRDIVDQLVPAEKLAESVKLGIKRLNNSKFIADNSALSLQEKLRPLFCPVEMNLTSDHLPNDASNKEVHIPLAFFVNPLLVNDAAYVNIQRVDYENALKKAGSHFEGTTLSDCFNLARQASINLCADC